MTRHGTDAARAQDAAERLRGFGPLGLIAVIVILAGSLAGPVVGALLVWAWVQISKTPPQALGFKAPHSWPVTLLVGVAFGVTFKLFAKALVMPLLGAPPINMPYHYLATAIVRKLPSISSVPTGR